MPLSDKWHNLWHNEWDNEWENRWYILVLNLVGPVTVIAFIWIGWWKHYRPLAIGLWFACIFLSIALRHLAYRRER